MELREGHNEVNCYTMWKIFIFHNMGLRVLPVNRKRLEDFILRIKISYTDLSVSAWSTITQSKLKRTMYDNQRL
jgi:hypothetical protein